eukprot:1143624-Pelagomonas_calceolata.AAC.2
MLKLEANLQQVKAWQAGLASGERKSNQAQSKCLTLVQWTSNFTKTQDICRDRVKHRTDP